MEGDEKTLRERDERRKDINLSFYLRENEK